MLGHMRWLIFTLSPTLLLADVVELKTGERLEGTFKQANAAGVVIEVGGQAINMPLAKVRAIYLGPAPQATVRKSSSALDALEVLKTLQSVTQVGVTYRNYLPRVADTKTAVAKFLATPQQKGTNFAIKHNIELAMRYYELAAHAWTAKINTDLAAAAQVRETLQNQEIASCPVLHEWLMGHTDPGLPDATPLLLGAQPSILWTCASGKIAETERILK